LAAVNAAGTSDVVDADEADVVVVDVVAAGAVEVVVVGTGGGRECNGLFDPHPAARRSTPDPNRARPDQVARRR
jgi:hypothetical protein